MLFGLSAEQTLLKDSIEQFLRERVPLRRVRQFADSHADHKKRAHDIHSGDTNVDDIDEGLAELGVPGLLIPEHYGGVGLAPLDACLVAESLGNHVTPYAFASNAVMAPTALLLAASAAQKEHWLPQIASGKVVVGSALSELSGAREDAGVTADSSSRLSGRAQFVIDFQADAYLVADREQNLFLVEANAKGLTRKPFEAIDRTRPVGELLLDQVAADALVSATSPGVTSSVLAIGRAALAADTVGAAQHMLDQAVQYAGQREQFGRVIASFQAVKHMCAEMASSLEPTRSMVWYVGHALGESQADAVLAACHLKAHISEVGQMVAKTATEVHGGIGFTDLLGLHYWFKRIGMNRQLLGSPQRLRREAARIQGLTPD